MRNTFLVLFVVAFVGCDPIYRESVINNAHHPVPVVIHYQDGSKIHSTLEPGASFVERERERYAKTVKANDERVSVRQTGSSRFEIFDNH